MDNQSTQDYTKVTARGDKVVNMKKDGNGRDTIIIELKNGMLLEEAL